MHSKCKIFFWTFFELNLEKLESSSAAWSKLAGEFQVRASHSSLPPSTPPAASTGAPLTLANKQHAIDHSNHSSVSVVWITKSTTKKIPKKISDRKRKKLENPVLCAGRSEPTSNFPEGSRRRSRRSGWRIVRGNGWEGWGGRRATPSPTLKKTKHTHTSFKNKPGGEPWVRHARHKNAL